MIAFDCTRQRPRSKAIAGTCPWKCCKIVRSGLSFRCRPPIRAIVKDPRNDTGGVAFPPPSALSSLRRMSCSLWISSRRCEPVGEECKDLIAGCDRRLTGLVDQMSGHDTVRGRDITREERRHIGIRCAIRKNPAYEAIAKRLRIGRKALGRAEFVAVEPICRDR